MMGDTVTVDQIKQTMGYVANPSSPRCSGCAHGKCRDYENADYMCELNPAFHFRVNALGTCSHHASPAERKTSKEQIGGE